MASNDNDTPVSKDENQPGTSKTQQIKVKKVDSDSSDIEVEEDKSVPPYNSEQLPLPQNDLEIDEISTLDLSNFVEVPSSQNYGMFIDNDPFGIQEWIETFVSWQPDCRYEALDNLVKNSSVSELKIMQSAIIPILEEKSLKNLPRDILSNIFRYFEPTDIFNVAKTCIRWRTISEEIWIDKALNEHLLIMHDPAFCRTFEFNIWEKLYMQICIARRQSEINNNVNFSCLLRHNRSPITCIHLDPYTLVTGLADGRVKIWNASSGNCVATFLCHDQAVTSLDIDNDLLVTSSKDMSISVFNILTKDHIISLIGHATVVSCVKILGERIASGSTDGVVFYWSIHKNTPLKLLHVFHFPCQYITLRGSWVLAADTKGDLRMWSSDTGIILSNIDLMHTGINCIDVDKANMAIGFYSGRIDIFSWKTKAHSYLYPMSSRLAYPVVKLKLNDNILYSLHERAFLKCWNIKTGNLLKVFSRDCMRTHVVDLFLRPNGVLVMFFDGEIKMWNIESDSVKSMLGNIEPFEIKGCVQELTVFALGPNYSKNLVVIYRNNGFGIDSMESIFVSPFLHD